MTETLTEITATEKAEALKAVCEAAFQLVFTVDVWNNLGWCFQVKSGGIKFSDRQHERHNTSRYICYLSDSPCAGGYWVGRGETVFEALEATLVEAEYDMLPKQNAYAEGLDARLHASNKDIMDVVKGEPA